MTATGIYDVVIVGGGPAGAVAASDLARQGRSVLLLDKGGRIKPCGGAIPPRLIAEFNIPESLLVARIGAARMVAPSGRQVDMPIDSGFVGMVDREHFDEWLRQRAALCGAERRTGTFEWLGHDADGTAIVNYSQGRDGAGASVRARAVIGADGASSRVAAECLPDLERPPYVYAYHEIVQAPQAGVADYDHSRCDVYYQGKVSPDFYGWVFPHGPTVSIGAGTALKGYSLRHAVDDLKTAAGLGDCAVVRREGAPLPLHPLKRWDNGRDVVLAGDAAGVVAPASGEGIYYAMLGGRLAAEAVDEFLASRDPRALGAARRRFMKAHGRVFWILGMMQRFWYRSDRRRERFVSICRDRDVQHLTWEAYMHKRLVRAKPAAHVRIFFKDLAHLMGLVAP